MRKYVITGIVVILVLLVMVFTATSQYKAIRLLSYLQPHRDLVERLLLPGRRVYTFSVKPLAGDETEGLIVSPSPDGTETDGVVLLPGTYPNATRNPQVLALAKGLAENGEIVYIPGITSLFNAEITDATLMQSEQAVTWFAQSRYVQGGKVSVFGICAGASMAILTAEDSPSKPLVKTVVAVTPYASLYDVLLTTVTGYGPDFQGFVQPFRMNPWTRWEVAHSAAYTINDQKSRDAFLQAIGAEPDQGDPFSGLKTQPPPNLSQSATAWWRLFADSSVSDFASYYAALPTAVRGQLAVLSPVTNIDQLSVPVYVIAPVLDTDYPQWETVRLQQGNSKWVDMTLTNALNHVTPEINSFRNFLTLLRFTIKVAAG